MVSLRRGLLYVVLFGLALSICSNIFEVNRQLWGNSPLPEVPNARASLESTRTCCFKGIRCDPDDSYNIFVIQSERKDGRLKLMYAPITQSLVTGLQSREEECGYTTIKVLPETKSDIFKYPVMPRSGDVIIYVGTLNSTTFMNRCRTQMIPNKTYCIWYQVEPREWPNASLSPLEDSVCEVWEYTRGNTPKAPLVRYVPPGFLPTEADETTNDQLVMRRAQSMNPATLQWYFIGRLGPIRQKCWDKLQSLKYFRKHELNKIPQGGAKGYPKVYTMEDWRNLGRNLKNVIFLNIHQACNRDQPLETKPLETVRLAQLLSLGFTVISEEANSLDSELYKDIVLVEKDIFHEKKWSPSLVRLLQNKSALVEWQLSAYHLFKQLFRPSKLLHDAHVWDGGMLMQSSCQTSLN